MASDVDYENDHQSKIWAYELIEMFAGALKTLNGGKPAPKEWLDKLNKELSPQKTGKPRNPEITNRDKAMSRELLDKKIAIQRGDSNEQMKTVIPDLEKKYGVKNASRIYSEYKTEVISDVLTERLNKKDIEAHTKKVAKANAIKERMERGENIDDILLDPNIDIESFLTILNYPKNDTLLEIQPPKPRLTECEKVRAWISDGMNRHVKSSTDHGIYYDVPEEIIAAFNRKK